MPSFSWTVVATGARSTGHASALVPFHRRVDPTTGENVFDDARRSWAAAVPPDSSPMAEVVARCLRTRKGSAARDPGYGLDMSSLDNARDNAPALARQAVIEALTRYVAAMRIKNLAVDVEVQGDLLALEVTFTDARGLAGTVTGTP